MDLSNKNMTSNYSKAIVVLLLLQISLSCTFQEGKRNGQNEELKSGEAIVDHLDDLFKSLQSKKTTDIDFQESVMAINEAIRQTIERNIKSPRLMKEIQTYFPGKKHAFSFIFSSDGKFGVFSWITHIKEFPIKNMAFYTKGNSIVPTSLYGTPYLYNQMDIIQSNSGFPTYLLGGLKNTSTTAHHYHLSSYMIRKDGIEETKVFPNGESSITIRCNEQNLKTCLEIENGKSLPKTLYSAVAQQTLAFDNGEYVFE